MHINPRPLKLVSSRPEELLKPSPLKKPDLRLVSSLQEDLDTLKAKMSEMEKLLEKVTSPDECTLSLAPSPTPTPPSSEN